MRVLLSVCGVLAVLTIVCMATGQEGEKRTIKQRTMFLIDAKTKGIVKGTGIKQIEILEGTVAKKVLLDAKDTSGKELNFFNREFVVKSVKMTLADNTVVEGQILLTKETGKAILRNMKMRDSGEFVSDKGTRTWNTFLAEYDVAADSSKENIAQAKKDMEALQGTWQENKMQKVVVKGDRLSRIDSRPGQEETITGIITIDPKTKAIDWPMETGLAAGITMMGIYELKGDDLKIYFGSDGDFGRAKTFDEKDGWLLVLKREKP